MCSRFYKLGCLSSALPNNNKVTNKYKKRYILCNGTNSIEFRVPASCCTIRKFDEKKKAIICLKLTLKIRKAQKILL